MTDSEAMILRQYCTDVSLCTAPDSTDSTPAGWSAYVGAEPEKPDNCLTFYDTDGPDDGRVMVTGDVVGPNGVQIRVRSINYPTGWTKANAVRNQLMLNSATYPYQRPVTVNGRNYVIECVVGIGPVLSLGKQLPNSRLNLFTLNVLVRAREA